MGVAMYDQRRRSRDGRFQKMQVSGDQAAMVKDAPHREHRVRGLLVRGCRQCAQEGHRLPGQDKSRGVMPKIGKGARFE